MFSVFKKKKSLLDSEINSVIIRLGQMEPETEDYEKTVESLLKLYEMKAIERGNRVSRDTIWVGIFSLLSTGAVLHYEKLGIITSKAFQYILRSRLK